MKKLTIVALLSAQLAAQPVLAADLGPAQEQRAGAFGGFRLRAPLDGPARERQVRAGLTLAPTLHSQAMDGRRTLRIGEGVEFGYRSNRTVGFSLAGRDLGGRQFGAAQDDDNDGGGISTLGWIAIGVGVLAVATVVLFESCRDGGICGSDRDG